MPRYRVTVAKRDGETWDILHRFIADTDKNGEYKGMDVNGIAHKVQRQYPDDGSITVHNITRAMDRVYLARRGGKDKDNGGEASAQ